MSEQNKLYLPSPGQPVRLAFRWDDIEREHIFLQMTPEGIIVAPANEGKKETTPHKQKIYFYPWRSLDFIVWFADNEEVKKDD